MKVRVWIVALAAMLAAGIAFAGPASAALVTKTLTFDELSETPVDGLHTSGITFAFTVGGSHSNVALYGDYGPGITKYVSDPSLTGITTGQLTLTFDKPTKLLQFGLALDTPKALKTGFTVNLFDKTGASLGTFPVKTSIPVDFSEAQFTKKGLSIKKAVLTFNSAAADAFALDNLTYKTAA